MCYRIGTVACLLVLSLLGQWSAGGEATPSGPAAIDVNALRDKASPAACQVTVINGWGLPVAYANGFLFGQGRFMLTDLGAVGQAGVSSVNLKSQKGPTVTSKEFGLADTSTGLVALRAEGEGGAGGAGGLELAADAPAVDAAPTAVAIGSPWCKELAAAPGRLMRGPVVKDLAQRCGIATPDVPDIFLRVEGVRLDAASGAPVVNAQGAVVAVKIDLAARGLAVPLAVPAAPFRKALLASPPQLKPLSDLPKPVWPVRLLRLPGEPPTPAEFTKATQTVLTGMVCPTCNGRGRREGPRIGPFGWGCPTCRGDGVAFTPALKTFLSNAALDGTRGVWAPLADDRLRTAVHSAGRDMLKTLAQSPRGFQTAMATGFWSDMPLWHDSTFPRGAIFYGEVHETINGPDGKYVFLGPQNSKDSVAVRADLLAEATGKTAAGPKEWTAGMQVAILGAAISRFKAPSGEQGIYVLPFDWLPTPGLTITMPGGDRRMGPDRPDRPGPPDRADRTPDGPRQPGPGGPGQNWGGVPWRR
jgi:hypothetical protein